MEVFNWDPWVHSPFPEPLDKSPWLRQDHGDGNWKDNRGNSWTCLDLPKYWPMAFPANWVRFEAYELRPPCECFLVSIHSISYAELAVTPVNFSEFPPDQTVMGSHKCFFNWAATLMIKHETDDLYIVIESDDAEIDHYADSD